MTTTFEGWTPIGTEAPATISANQITITLYIFLTVDLLAVDTVDVNDPLLTVDLDDLALTTLQGATDNQNFVILADRNGASLITVDCWFNYADFVFFSL